MRAQTPAVGAQMPAESNRRHTLDADTTTLPFSVPLRRLGDALQGGPARVPAKSAPQVAWGNNDVSTCTTTPHPTVDVATQERRTALQREFQAVQQARAIEQTKMRAHLAELQL